MLGRDGQSMLVGGILVRFGRPLPAHGWYKYRIDGVIGIARYCALVQLS